MKAREIVHSIVQHRLALELKREGFRKSQLTFARRRGTTSHLVQIQLSSWNSGSRGAFYINLGVMFDEMRFYYGRNAPAIPKYDDCDFNAVNNLADFQHTGWVNAILWSFPARYFYLLGDYEKAKALVESEAYFFRNRGITYKALVERYSFTKLQL